MTGVQTCALPIYVGHVPASPCQEAPILKTSQRRAYPILCRFHSSSFFVQDVRIGFNRLRDKSESADRTDRKIAIAPGSQGRCPEWFRVHEKKVVFGIEHVPLQRLASVSVQAECLKRPFKSDLMRFPNVFIIPYTRYSVKFQCAG